MTPKCILHVASRAEHYRGARYYGISDRINNGLVRAAHHVYWFSDRDMGRYLAPIPSRKFGTGPCKIAFLKYCADVPPEVIALCHADIIRPETLHEARKLLPGVRRLWRWVRRSDRAALPLFAWSALQGEVRPTVAAVYFRYADRVWRRLERGGRSRR